MSDADRRYNHSEKGKARYKRYNRSDKGRARSLQRREKAREAGLCTKCCMREAEFGGWGGLCVRCLRYNAEYSFVGYSSIPLARGSMG